MGRTENVLVTAALCLWALLGVAHTTIVLVGPKGLRPDRSAPGAAAVIGHPDETDPRLVAGPRALVEAAESDPGARLLLVLPEATDSTSLLYARYQLAHVLHPRRVEVLRSTATAEPRLARIGDELVVAGAGVAPPPGCVATVTAYDHTLLDCAR